MTGPDTAHLSRREVLKLGAIALPAVAGGAHPGTAFAQPSEPATPPGAGNAPIQTLVEGNTAFALNLYAALRPDTAGNLFFSPYSVSLALAMTYAGAAGETATQMAQTLAFDLDQPELHAAFADLTDDLVMRGNAKAGSGTVEVGGLRVTRTARALLVANGLWGERTYPFSPAYSAQLEEFYDAGLQAADFKNAPEEAREEINGWVAEQTEDRIRDIVPEDAITKDTRLVLANAIYFYGGWEDWFSPEATEDGDFFLLDGTTVTVPFMFQHDHFAYAPGDGYQVVELPYLGSGFAFTAILPDEGGFEEVEAALDAEALSVAIGQLEYTEVLVYLPKFSFEFGTIGLNSALQQMGMADAFDPNRADFTGMVEGTPPEPLFVGDVLHKAFIAVDENGTEAAAATVVDMAAGAAPPEEEPPVIRMDRPFLFAIRDTVTGTLLFLGRVMDPTA